MSSRKEKYGEPRVPAEQAIAVIRQVCTLHDEKENGSYKCQMSVFNITTNDINTFQTLKNYKWIFDDHAKKLNNITDAPVDLKQRVEKIREHIDTQLNKGLSTQKPIPTQLDIMEAFRKIYRAIYSGDSSFNKTGKYPFVFNLSFEELGSHPNEAVTLALNLAKEHALNCHPHNTALYDRIYKYTLKNSGFWSRSHIFGFFFRSRLTTRTVGVNWDYLQKNPHCRSSLIARCLA